MYITKDNTEYYSYIDYWEKYIKSHNLPKYFNMKTIKDNSHTFVWAYATLHFEMNLQENGSIFWILTKKANPNIESCGNVDYNNLNDGKLLLIFTSLKAAALLN